MLDASSPAQGRLRRSATSHCVFFWKKGALRRVKCDIILGKARVWVIHVYILTPCLLAFLLYTVLSLPLVIKLLHATSVRTVIASDVLFSVTVISYRLSTIVGFSSFSPARIYSIVINSYCNFNCFFHVTWKKIQLLGKEAGSSKVAD